MKVTTFVYYSHLLFIVANDFNEVTHDVREESYTTQHNYNCQDSLLLADRVVVSITYCT